MRVGGADIKSTYVIGVAFTSFPRNEKEKLFQAKRKWVRWIFHLLLLNSHVIPCITLLNCIFHCVILRKNSFSHLNHKRRENCHFYMKNSFLFHPLLAIKVGRRKNSVDISLKNVHILFMNLWFQLCLIFHTSQSSFIHLHE